MFKYLFVAFTLLATWNANAQVYQTLEYQYLSYGKVPTWSAIAAQWETAQPSIHLYDYVKYKGHAAFVSKGLKTGITFKQFKAQVKFPATRKYVPFFLFDLRTCPITIGNTTYHWAIRLEDYSYTDSKAQMAQTVLRLLELVNAHVNKHSTISQNGMVILATNKKAQPNIGIAPMVQQKGYPNRTLGQLLKLVGGKRVEVLNEGTAVGKLRYVQEGETPYHNFKDIVVFEKLPKRVPPVNGIVTLTPQTPLSHVNLLAKNRGTVNIYATEMQDIPGLKRHMGKLVKLECKGDKVSISAINQADAEQFWSTQQKPALTLPPPNVDEKELILFDTKGVPAVVNVIGAKASNYALLQKHCKGYVKPGAAIPFYYYFEAIEQCGAAAMIDTLYKRKKLLTPEQIADRLSEIRTAIKAHSLNETLITKLLQYFQNAPQSNRFRLRSSTNCEDLPEFNGAGLYLSKGYNVSDSKDKLIKKILQVYASLWTLTAFEEREFYQIDHTRAGMAILIHEAFPNEYANGVALTIPDNNSVALYINSQYGNALVTNPENGQVPESILFPSLTNSSYEVSSKSNIAPVFTQEDMQPLLLELQSISAKIHQLLTDRVIGTDVSFGVDIEFKVMEVAKKRHLYIKQARLLGIPVPDH